MSNKTTTATTPKPKRLYDEHKRFIVEALACFQTATQVARAANEQFGLQLTKQAVQAYDPTTKAGAGLSVELRELFESARREYLSSVEKFGVYHQAFRLQVIQNGADACIERGNHRGAAEFCAQAAREVGGQFQARNVVAINAAPLDEPRWDLSKLTEDEIETLERIGEKVRRPDPT